MRDVFLGVGSNIGDREAYCRAALELLENKGLARICACSSLLETDPWGKEDQPRFLNMVVEVETSHAARELLKGLRVIEAELGRAKGERWGPREIDLDILLYGLAWVTEPELCIPHPRMHERRFVLESMAELAPDLVHPALHRSMKELLEACEDSGRVVNLGKPSWAPCADIFPDDSEGAAA